ncbi:dienelactone hydrolase family protein [Sinomicrobium weinanense]|uniref:Dienelactone hydrolase family protein n=1 Tax=Sinomicrobium weinanense TaxID=2842200 RepID=A0A926JR19_9FLAO|nr:dienelactone hydrolase family protein [Sinomicrobium weinanense]MBC9795796.1 dienelactone hydrolase family protein [Sinomicrobium weinanense]MBU3121840.1 dienelactone hydrolase family protein [Sinomicrobium weinanense]
MTDTVNIALEKITLKGILTIPEKARGIIIFSHGSGSSRLSPRNNRVAVIFNTQGFASLLFDLLSEKEDAVYENRFDIELLTQRLIDVTNWIKNHPKIKGLPICYFGASTGAASALKAAAYFGNTIKAVVSRGGRPDLAGDNDLHTVNAATLLIVGGWDQMVLQLNREAYAKLHGKKRLEIIPEASHLFEEPGKLEQATAISVNWFKKHLNT